MAEELKACRYRVEKTGYGFWPYCVRAGDGTRELFKGHQKQCMVVAAELETAFEDGKFVAERAILPSQGGEAVSLELVENLKYGGMHIRKWENLAGLGAGTHKLYTHPADQVEDDLTMVKVSRELLQDLCDLASDAVEHHREAFAGYKIERQANMDETIKAGRAFLEVKDE